MTKHVITSGFPTRSYTNHTVVTEDGLRRNISDLGSRGIVPFNM